MKFGFFIGALLSLVCIGESIQGQINCTKEQIFAEKKCAGDDISKDEQQLQFLINQYRKENELDEIPISRDLSIVANRHLLDLQENLKFLTHSWSNCPYDIKNKNTWNCITEAPRRLNTEHSGEGFENLYRNLSGNANPSLALEGWKKSPLHNSLILNLGGWKSSKWSSIGVSIRGQYAAIWLGTNDADKAISDYKSPKGLGLSFQDVVKNLTSIVSIEKTSTVLENDKWVGSSKDKSVILELYGEAKDISEAALSLKIKLDPQNNLSQRNKNLVVIYLKNIFSSTSEGEKWFTENFATILKNKRSTQSFIKDNKVMELRIDSNNYLTLSAKPFRKTNSGAIEIK